MRFSSLPGGPLEYAVLAALWQLGSASARKVHEIVGRSSDLAYTTTATVLDRLHAKSLVTRAKVGRAFVYRPRETRETVERARAQTTLRQLLGGDPRPAIATLVDAMESIDPALLDELGRAVKSRRRGRRGS
jgi:predicted transcriptional regulator